MGQITTTQEYVFRVKKYELHECIAFGFTFIIDNEWGRDKYISLNFYKYQLNIGWFLEWRK